MLLYFKHESPKQTKYVLDKYGIGFGIESSNSMESDISSGDETLTDSTYENFKREKAYKAVPPPTGTIIPPRANVSFTGIDELAIRNKVVNQEKTKSSQSAIDINKVIIEDWVDSDDEETDVSESKKETAFNSENSETSFENRSPNSVGQESRTKGLGNKGGLKGKQGPVWNKHPGRVSTIVISQELRMAMISPKQTWETKRDYLDSVNTGNGSYTLKQYEASRGMISRDYAHPLTVDALEVTDRRTRTSCRILKEFKDFEKVSYVEELKFNLLSVSQICDKKHNVLFTDKECLILSPKFKFVDEDLVILRAPRKNDVLQLDLKNIFPLVESLVWLQRQQRMKLSYGTEDWGQCQLSKNINKLVKVQSGRGLLQRHSSLITTCDGNVERESKIVDIALPGLHKQNGVAEERIGLLLKLLRELVDGKSEKDIVGIILLTAKGLESITGYDQQFIVHNHSAYAPEERTAARKLKLSSDDQALHDELVSLMQEESLANVITDDLKGVLLNGGRRSNILLQRGKDTCFEDPAHPNKVYRVVKALYGLHQAPRAWYERLSTFLLKHGYRRGAIDKTLFIKKDRELFMLVRVYVMISSLEIYQVFYGEGLWKILCKRDVKMMICGTTYDRKDPLQEGVNYLGRRTSSWAMQETNNCAILQYRSAEYVD
ncbi:putative ribonuclease H-like domain-containing protein [Tanacetum coccineum]